MEEALFFRKCANETEYFKLANNYPEYGSKLKFKIPKYLVDSKFIESFTTQHWGRYYPNQKRNLMQQEK